MAGFAVLLTRLSKNILESIRMKKGWIRLKIFAEELSMEAEGTVT